MSFLSNNESALKLVKKIILHVKTKHIKLHYHFIQEKAQEGEIEVMYVHTIEQEANIFTKPLGRHRYITSRNLVSVLNHL
jgi:hypothetical protein